MPRPDPANFGMRLRALSDIAEATDVENAWETLERLRHDLGFEHLAFGAIESDGTAPMAVTQYRTDSIAPVIDDYHAGTLYRTDPVLAALSNGALRGSPTHGDHKYSGNGIRRVRELFRAHKITGHVVLRVNLPMDQGAAYFGAGNHREEPEAAFRQRADAEDAFLRLMATIFTAKLDRPGRKSMAIAISPAERTVLRHLARGLTPEEIAEAEGKALPTVRHQIYSAKRRLGAQSVTQAVVMADRLGLTR